MHVSAPKTQSLGICHLCLRGHVQWNYLKGNGVTSVWGQNHCNTNDDNVGHSRDYADNQTGTHPKGQHGIHRERYKEEEWHLEKTKTYIK